MLVGILSGIHGNLEGLEAVLSECDERELDEINCLGDVVGYGAHPVACLDLVRRWAAFTCAGNHDWAASGRITTNGFNPMAVKAITWTRFQLAREDLRDLSTLPLSEHRDDALFVHASLNAPESFHYVSGASEAFIALGHTDAQLTFLGHSYGAFVYEEGVGEVLLVEGEIVLDGASRGMVTHGRRSVFGIKKPGRLS